MNTISSKITKSIHKAYDTPFWGLNIDDKPLDEYFEYAFPGNEILGLIPVCSGWLTNKDDEEYFWKMILPPIRSKTTCPILICPDDQDYSCTTIIAEIHNAGDCINWCKIGISLSDGRNYEEFEKMTKWLEMKFSIRFTHSEYKAALSIIANARGILVKDLNG